MPSQLAPRARAQTSFVDVGSFKDEIAAQVTAAIVNTVAEAAARAVQEIVGQLSIQVAAPEIEIETPVTVMPAAMDLEGLTGPLEALVARLEMVCDMMCRPEVTDVVRDPEGLIVQTTRRR
jgi:hypothetical protein